MALLPIKIYGEPVLREKAQEMKQEDIDDAFRAFIADMAETMYDARGIGLAAPQVGDLRRVFVVDTEQTDGDSKRRRVRNPEKRRLVTCINPEIIETSAEDEEYNEGCLSIPDVEADVWRPIRVKVRYRTLEWELKEEWLDELMARVFQHELDHLDGVLFVDHLGMMKRTALAGKLNRLKKQSSGK